MAIIYKITNTVNGKIYIGYTKRTLDKRWSGHCKASNNTKFANAIRKYGPDAFIKEILVEDEDAEKCLNYWEPLFIAQFNSTDPAVGYNITTGGGLMFTTASEYKAKHSAAMARPEVKAKRSAALKALWADPEYRAKQKAALTSPEVNAKRSAGLKAAHARPDYVAKYRAARKACWADAKIKAKHIAAAKASWSDPEYKAKQRDARKATWADPEVKAKRSAALKAIWVDPEYRAKMTAIRQEQGRKRKEQNNVNSATT